MSETTSVKQQTTGATSGRPSRPSGSRCAVTLGIYFLDADAWVRAFLAIGVLYLVTSCFTLAKVIRDRQEAGQLVSRVDQARLEKILAEHDPFQKL
ncbi:hypothetical protein GTV15_10220 [Streptomyces sp. SID7803]|nr:hypothetical protein [Streptomyces sp. SID7803]